MWGWLRHSVAPLSRHDPENRGACLMGPQHPGECRKQDCGNEQAPLSTRASSEAAWSSLASWVLLLTLLACSAS